MWIQREICWLVFGVEAYLVSGCWFACSGEGAGIKAFGLAFSSFSSFLFSLSVLCPITPSLFPAALLAGPSAVQGVGVGVGQLSGPLPCGAALRQLGGFGRSGPGVGHRGRLELLLWEL